MATRFSYAACAAGQISAYRWEPAGEPKAVVQIVHGVAEHALRYAQFADFLTSQGYLVVAQDHLGHGNSVCEECGKGDFAGDWFQAVADCHELFCQVRSQYRHLPYILLGHSMGSFMVRTLIARYPETSVQAVILSGTAWMGSGLLRSGKMMASLVGFVRGNHRPSKLITKLMLGNRPRGVNNPRTPYDWLSRDENMVDAYAQDPLCGFSITPALAKAMLQGLLYNQDPTNLRRMPKSLPVLLVAGEEDPVGDYGEGVRKTAQAFSQAGMQQVTLKLYPQDRHEILNECDRQQVYADLLCWMDQQIRA